MEERKHTELDKFFKSRLENTDPAENGWNLPPLSILDSALAQVPTPKSNKRKYGILWILGAIGVMGIIYLGISNLISINTINGELITLKNTTSLTNQNNYQLQTKTIDKSSAQSVELSHAKPKAQIATTTSDHLKSTSTDISMPKSSKRDLSTKEQNSLRYTRLKIAKNQTSTSPTILENHKSNQPIFEQSKSTITLDTLQVPQIIASLPLDTLSYEATDFSIVNASVDLITTTSQSNTKASVFLTGGILNSCLHMTNIDAAPFSLTKYDEFYQGYSVGMGARRALTTKISLSGTLSFNLINNKSLFEDEVSYNSAKEVEQLDGSMTYNSDVFMETPMASFNDMVSYRLLDNTITDGTLLQHKTDISEQYQLLQLTLSADYTIFSKDRISGTFSTGLSTNYILGIDQTMDSKVYQANDMLMNMSLSNDLTSEVNRVHLSGTINLGISYRLTDNIYLQLSGGYEKGITSVRKYSNNSLPKTFISSLSSGLNVGYTF